MHNLYLYPDIYFEPTYAKLYANKDEKVVEFRHESALGVITNLFIIRKVPYNLEDKVQYYDIVTPYGYGGPIIHNTSNKDKLIKEYLAEFQKYVDENNIIAEFIRFHPLLNNALDFKEIYNSIYDRKTVGTNLTYEDVISTEFSKHKRKDIRRILKNPNIRFEINENPIKLDEFIEIYYSTMERNKADSYYFFNKNYFDELLKKFQKNIITCKVFFKEKLIAMGVYFRYGKLLHAHLSGSLTEYLEFSPAYILKYAMAIYGHEKNYELIHYGGGTTASPENFLYKFKKDFGKNTEFDFYISKKIWNPSVYNQMCQKAGVDPNSSFFPAYRSKR